MGFETFMKRKVFLGGTCNKSTWREELIPMLDNIGVKYFNPVVDDWTPECQQEERRQRIECDFCLYCITKEMTGVYSIAEVVQDSNKRPRTTLFCVLKDGFDQPQLRSLQQVMDMVQNNGATVFTDLKQVVDHLHKIG